MIRVTNRNKKYKVDEILIKKMVREVLREVEPSPYSDIEVVFLSDMAMRRLNRKYKRTDRTTDVLSFRLEGPGPGVKFTGDIFISIDRAVVNSKRFGTHPAEELVLYLIHGILHLFDYDDRTPKDRYRMDARQQEILNSLCRDLSPVLTPL